MRTFHSCSSYIRFFNVAYFSDKGWGMKPTTPNPAPPNPSWKLPEQFHTTTWVQNLIIVCLNDGLFKRCDILVSNILKVLFKLKKSG